VDFCSITAPLAIEAANLSLPLNPVTGAESNLAFNAWHYLEGTPAALTTHWLSFNSSFVSSHFSKQALLSALNTFCFLTL
jgi:hypothetical protein